MDEKILITGAGGFIGRSLKEYFCSFENNVFWYTKDEMNLENSEEVKRLLKREKYDIIIHCATYDASPRFSVKDKTQVYSKNMCMFENLISNREYFGKMFYFGSGIETVKQVINQYALSKREMSRRIQNTKDIYNLRLYSVYGKYADCRYRVLNNMCAKAAKNLPLVVPENKISDFLNVEDLSKIVSLFLKKSCLNHKIYDICSGQVHSYDQVSQMVASESGFVEIKKSKNYKDCSFEYFGDNRNLLEEIKHEFTPIKTGIKSLIEYYKQQNLDIAKFEY
mgnify:CR=1 FL=1